MAQQMELMGSSTAAGHRTTAFHTRGQRQQASSDEKARAGACFVARVLRVRREFRRWRRSKDAKAASGAVYVKRRSWCAPTLLPGTCPQPRSSAEIPLELFRPKAARCETESRTPRQRKGTAARKPHPHTHAAPTNAQAGFAACSASSHRSAQPDSSVWLRGSARARSLVVSLLAQARTGAAGQALAPPGPNAHPFSAQYHIACPTAFMFSTCPQQQPPPACPPPQVRRMWRRKC